MIERHSLMRVAAAAKAAGALHSLWKVAGFPGAGATPPTGGGGVPTSSNEGAIPIANAGFLGVMAAGSVPGALVVYDRLVHTSGLSGVVTSPQAVNTVGITRGNVEGAGVELWLEVYSATGTTPQNVTASYTNQAGVSGRTSQTITFPSSPAVGQMLPLPLAGGDSGVKSVQSVTLAGSTGTAGDFGVTLLRRLVMLPLVVSDLPVWSPPGRRSQVYADSCVVVAVLASGTDTGLIVGEIEVS